MEAQEGKVKRLIKVIRASLLDAILYRKVFSLL